MVEIEGTVSDRKSAGIGCALLPKKRCRAFHNAVLASFQTAEQPVIKIILFKSFETFAAQITRVFKCLRHVSNMNSRLIPSLIFHAKYMIFYGTLENQVTLSGSALQCQSVFNVCSFGALIKSLI